LDAEHVVGRCFAQEAPSLLVYGDHSRLAAVEKEMREDRGAAVGTLAQRDRRPDGVAECACAKARAGGESEVLRFTSIAGRNGAPFNVDAWEHLLAPRGVPAVAA